MPRAQVLGEQYFAGAPLERAEVLRVDGEPGRVVVEALDFMGMRKSVLTVVIDHQPCYRGVPRPRQAFARQPSYDVYQPANVLCYRPGHRYPQQAGQM